MKNILLPFAPRESRNISRKFNGTYLDRYSYDRLIRADAIGKEAETGETKFVFLRSQFRPETIREVGAALTRLAYRTPKPTSRMALRGGLGGEAMMGWYSDRNGLRRYVGPTANYPLFYHFHLIPLLNAVSGLVKKHLFEYWNVQAIAARANGRCRIGSERGNPDGVSVFRPEMLMIGRSEISEEIFSTVTINKTVICRSHADGNNESGMSCLLAFGDFRGRSNRVAPSSLPRYRCHRDRTACSS